MEVISNGNEMIFRKDFDGGVRYSIGLSRKNQDGSYTRGYMPISFRKGVELNNKTQIRINNAWLDFYKDKEERTIPYIFVSEFEIAKEESKDPFEEFGQSITTKSRLEEQLDITDADLPF